MIEMICLHVVVLLAVCRQIIKYFSKKWKKQLEWT